MECPEPNRPGCPYASQNGCFSDVHHTYWPRVRYTTPTEKQFRELPENKEQVCRMIHEEYHAVYPEPEKPSRDVMLQAIADSAKRIGDAA